MELNPTIHDELLANAPTLRSFALSLCGTMDRAEDLVQDTFLRALTHYESFQPGTNLAAWLVTILRNVFRDQYRKRQREVEDAEGRYAEALTSEPEQTALVEFGEFRAALTKLPAEQRDALLLVGASGITFRYTENGPVGLFEGKRAIVIESRGGFFSDGPTKGMDAQEPHLRTLLGFMGIKDVTFVRAEKLAQ
jgi:RNA polymerase sigma-70 factor, ECF subfamily